VLHDVVAVLIRRQFGGALHYLIDKRSERVDIIPIKQPLHNAAAAVVDRKLHEVRLDQANYRLNPIRQRINKPLDDMIPILREAQLDEFWLDRLENCGDVRF
jgi:hypothetical protein